MITKLIRIKGEHTIHAIVQDRCGKIHHRKFLDSDKALRWINKSFSRAVTKMEVI